MLNRKILWCDAMREEYKRRTHPKKTIIPFDHQWTIDISDQDTVSCLNYSYGTKINC